MSDKFHEEKEVDNEDGKDDKETTTREKVKYDDVTIQPLLVQDDVWNAANSVEDAQVANNKMEEVLEKKLLNLNLDKSSYLVAGAKKARKQLEEQINRNPLTLCNTNMMKVKEAKYLGIWLSGSVSDSVAATVSHRIGLASRSIYEIKAVIEDSRADSLGAVEVGLTLWEQSILPFLLFASETWDKIPSRTMKQLTDLNNRFLKSLMGVGKHGCPVPGLYLETASWTM